MSCLKIVLSINGVEPPSSSLMLDRKGKGVTLQSSMWNILSKSDEYLDFEITIPEAFCLTSIPMNCLNSPIYVIVNSLLKDDLMLLNPAAELLEMSKSSTYRTINNNEPFFCCM